MAIRTHAVCQGSIPMFNSGRGFKSPACITTRLIWSIHGLPIVISICAPPFATFISVTCYSTTTVVTSTTTDCCYYLDN